MKPTDPGARRVRRWACTMCSYCYDADIGDPARGHPPGTPFADLPEGWTCPWCGAPKRTFVPEEELFA